MDRASWLGEKRRLAEMRMDTLFAPGYDEHWGRVDPTHERMLGEFLSLLPAHGMVLDAACGTGKYWPIVLESGRRIVGTDHSGRMLHNAREKFPGVPIEKSSLQELRFEGELDGVICVDAMENVPPEDWPVVLRNFHRILHADGHLYLTVETASDEDVRAAFAAGRKMGLPLVEGEVAHEGGYHFYPGPSAVREWSGEASFRIIEEMVGDGYHHFLFNRL